MCIDFDFLCNHEGAIEADTELTNQIDILILLFLFFALFQKFLRARTGDCSKVLFKILFFHADTIIDDFKITLIFVSDKLDLIVFRLVFSFRLKHHQFIFIDSIRCVGNQFTQEYFLVRIDRIDH